MIMEDGTHGIATTVKAIQDYHHVLINFGRWYKTSDTVLSENQHQHQHQFPADPEEMVSQRAVCCSLLVFPTGDFTSLISHHIIYPKGRTDQRLYV